MGAWALTQNVKYWKPLAFLEKNNKKFQLQNEALETVINLAENEFKIPLRKKYGSYSKSSSFSDCRSDSPQSSRILTYRRMLHA